MLARTEFGGGACLLQCTVVLKLSGQTSGLMSFLNKSIRLDQADLNLVVACSLMVLVLCSGELFQRCLGRSWEYCIIFHYSCR